MREPLYGTIKTAQPIQLPRDSFVMSTPNPTGPADPRTLDAYYTIMRRDLCSADQHHDGAPEDR